MERNKKTTENIKKNEDKTKGFYLGKLKSLTCPSLK